MWRLSETKYENIYSKIYFVFFVSHLVYILFKAFFVFVFDEKKTYRFCKNV